MASFLTAIIAASALSWAAPRDTLTTTPIVHHLGVNLGYDFMASSYVDELRPDFAQDEKIFARSALPVQLRYSFSFTNPRIRFYFPGGYQGISVGVMNIGISDKGGVKKASGYIGNPVLAYVFQGAPFWHPTRNLSLNYEWNFGAAFGWKPYGPENEHFNLTVGSRVNAYLNLSLMLKWEITSRIALTGGVSLSHFSNGNTSWPNPGVNSIGLRLGLDYTFNPPSHGYQAAIPDTIRRRKTEFDITLWGSARKRVYLQRQPPVLLNGHYACAGLSFSPMVRLNPWWRVGGSADLQWDESSDLKKNYVEGSTSDDIRFKRPDFGRQLSFGISAHGELQMPVFAVNVGIGYNLVAPPENRGSYQNITLKTYFTRHIFLNIGYQLRNFRQQANLMIGMGVTI